MNTNVLRASLLALLAALALTVVPSSASALLTDETFETTTGTLGSYSAAGGGSGAQWARASDYVHTGGYSAFVPDPAGTSDKALRANPSFAIAVDAPNPTLTFYHRFDTEPGFDGGRLEVAADGGTFGPVPNDRFIQNGPTELLGGSGALAGNGAWTGFSHGFIKTVVDLAPYRGHSLALEFRFASDASIGAGGWWIDDVQLSGLQRDGGMTQTNAVRIFSQEQSGSLNQVDPPSGCGSAKPYPGKSTVAAKDFEVHNYVNLNREPACVTFTLDQPLCTADPGNAVSATAYSAFDPAYLSDNYLGALGTTAAVASASVVVSAGAHLVIDVNQVGPGNCNFYGLTVNAPPPETSFASGPSGETTSRSGSFALASSAAESSYECSLDGASFAPCNSPYVVSALPLGPHEVRARATDPNGATDPSPASRTFTVKDPSGGTPPPGGTLDRISPRVGALGLGKKKFRARTGTTVSYALSEAATAAFSVQRGTAGRKLRARCVKPTRSNRSRPRCTRYIGLGTFRRAGRSGTNTFKFARRGLSPGSYRLVLVATDAAGNRSKPAMARFTIVR
jgi:hypothetical protein